MCGALSDRFAAIAAAAAAAVPYSHFIISGSGGRIGAVANHGCARTRKMVRQKERGEGRGEGGKERGLREDVETKKGKNIVDVVGGGGRVGSRRRDYSNDSPLPLSHSYVYPVSTPHPWERNRDPRAGSPLSRSPPRSFSYEELMRSSGGANSKCRRSTFTATGESGSWWRRSFFGRTHSPLQYAAAAASVMT